MNSNVTAKTASELPVGIRVIEHLWIPLSDGVHLAARLWLPKDAEQVPVPAILEYIPYRKRDSTRARDEVMHHYVAGHGYACLRVDLRGSGESEGVLKDEYLPQEIDDGLEVICWIREQAWCNGEVGMIGISWGGFNGLQIAAARPPGLNAVVSVCSTDDRYTDDIHHMGGCLLSDNLSWASTMFAYNSLPPDPALVGDRWREMWLERLRANRPWLETWLQHQARDDYWKHGSICEDWSAVQCPVMAVSGWADGYSNAVFRLLANLQVPRLGLIGPWSHKYPHQGVPGPPIGFLQECVRWWNQWLKGEPSGIMKEPMLRAWMQDSVPPTTYYEERPGRWVGEPCWPSPNIQWSTWALAWPGTLEPNLNPVPERKMTLQSPLSVGLFAGKWCSYAATPDLPHDQRAEDGGAMVFTSEPLGQNLEILGAAEVSLTVCVNRPVAMLAVRLSDVAPDDKATRVTFGLLNLTHRSGSETPQPLVPGRSYRVQIRLNDVAQSFSAGHRIRLSISTSYWPLAWPSPESVRLTLITGHSQLRLPVRPSRQLQDPLIRFLPAEGAAISTKIEPLEPARHAWRVIRDLANDTSTLEVVNDQGIVVLQDLDLQMQRKTLEWYSFQGDDFNSVRGETFWERGFRRGTWSVRSVTRTVLTSTPSHFILHAQLDAYEGNRRVYADHWDAQIVRHLV